MAVKMSIRRIIDWLATRKELDTDWAAAETRRRRLVLSVVSLLELSGMSLIGSWKLINDSESKNVDTSGLLLDAVLWKCKNWRN